MLSSLSRWGAWRNFLSQGHMAMSGKADIDSSLSESSLSSVQPAPLSCGAFHVEQNAEEQRSHVRAERGGVPGFSLFQVAWDSSMDTVPEPVQGHEEDTCLDLCNTLLSFQVVRAPIPVILASIEEWGSGGLWVLIAQSGGWQECQEQTAGDDCHRELGVSSAALRVLRVPR